MEGKIICSKCKCKYNNDENTILTEFGYNNKHERFKTCKSCKRQSASYRRSHTEEIKNYNRLNQYAKQQHNKQYWLDHKNELALKNKQYYEQHKDDLNTKARQKRLAQKQTQHHDSLLEKEKQDSDFVNEVQKCNRCKSTKSILELRKWVTTQNKYRICVTCSACRDKSIKCNDSE